MMVSKNKYQIFCQAQNSFKVVSGDFSFANKHHLTNLVENVIELAADFCVI